jgi:hypothetical protein
MADTGNHHQNRRGGSRVTWHSAFCEAIRLELEPYKHLLRFMFEFPLISGPPAYRRPYRQMQ